LLGLSTSISYPLSPLSPTLLCRLSITQPDSSRVSTTYRDTPSTLRNSRPAQAHLSLRR